MEAFFEQIMQYHYILRDTTLVNKINPNYFSEITLRESYKLAKDYVLTYGNVPKKEIMYQLADDKEIDGLSHDVIDTIYAPEDNVNDIDRTYYHENIKARAKWITFNSALEKTIRFYKEHEHLVDTSNVSDITTRLIGIFQNNCEINFDDTDDGDGKDFFDALTHKQLKMVRKPTGYKFLDTCLVGGYFAGSLIVFVGAPKVGKSTWLLNLCANSSRYGNNNVYVSLEMNHEMVAQRLGSAMMNIPSMEYSTYSENTQYMTEQLRNLRNSNFTPMGDIQIKTYGTSTLTVPELENYLLSMEKKRSAEYGKPYKFHNIFVDYINIMCNYRNRNSENTYLKIKTLAEDLKAMGQRNGWAIITATQTKREQFGSADIDAIDVAESAGLNATVDAMFGIIATAEMKLTGEYWLKCIYDRVAPFENKKQRFDVRKEFQQITEPIDASIIDCADMDAGTSFNPLAHYKRKAVPDSSGAVPPVDEKPSIPVMGGVALDSSTSSQPVSGSFEDVFQLNTPFSM